MKVFYSNFPLFVDSFLILYILYFLPRNRYGWLRFEGFYGAFTLPDTATDIEADKL